MRSSSILLLARLVTLLAYPSVMESTSSTSVEPSFVSSTVSPSTTIATSSLHLSVTPTPVALCSNNESRFGNWSFYYQGSYMAYFTGHIEVCTSPGQQYLPVCKQAINQTFIELFCYTVLGSNYS